MGANTLADALAEYEKISSSGELPEAGAAHYLKRGALQGVSALADLAPNLYNLFKAGAGMAASAVGRPDLMPDVGGASPVAQFLLEGYGLDKPVRPSASIGGELGAAVLEGAGAAASQGPMALARAAPLAMAKNVGLQVARNAVVGGAAGAGAYTGREATGSEWGALAGGLAAGVAVPSSFLRQGGVTVGAARAGYQTLKDVKAQNLVNAASAKVEPAFSDYVGGTLRSAVAGTPNAAENLTEGLRLRNKIPGFNPSVAEMSASPGLIDMQKKFALLNPKNLNAEVARTEANAKAIQDFYRGSAPEAKSPSGVRSSVNQALADYDQVLQGEARGIAGGLPKNVNQLEIGEALAAAANAEKTAAKPAITAAYKKAFDAAGDSTVSAEGIISKTEQILGEQLSKIKPANAPQTASAIQRIFGDKSQTLEGRAIEPDLMAFAGVGGKTELSLKDLHDIRVAIGQDVASASRSMDPTASRRLYNLAQVMPEVDAAIAKLPQGARDAYRAATSKYRDEYAPRFQEGANARVFKDTSLNEPRILPDKFVSEYFKPDSQGGGTRALQFQKLFGASAEAKQLANTGILDIYNQKVVNPTTGTIDQAAHNVFMRDYGRTLHAYKSAGVDAAGEIKRVGHEASKVTRSMEKLSSLSKAMKFDTVDELVADALKNPKSMGNTITRLGAEQRTTFNTLLLDKAFESGTASGMYEFLAANRKTLAMSVPKEQISAMQDIAKALSMTERAPIRGSIAAGGADMLKNASGVSTATVFSQIRAVTGQRSSVEWAAINLAMPALNKMTQTSFANVMENALHSPQSAVALRNYLLAGTPEQANKWATRLIDTMKRSGKLVWSAKGPITSNFIGPERYPENLARTGAAIRSQMQPEQEQQQ